MNQLDSASCILDTPLGPLFVEANCQGVTRIAFVDVMAEVPALVPIDNPILVLACEQLLEYFKGQRRVFDLPLAPRGTDFQNQVWRALGDIAYGEACSYGQLAHAINKPTAARAVGAANGRNPIFIVVPCHRVNGKDGSLTGYAGGLERKKWLLALEEKHLNQRA